MTTTTKRVGGGLLAPQCVAASRGWLSELLLLLRWIAIELRPARQQEDAGARLRRMCSNVVDDEALSQQ